jgi:tartrate-resistant acid phosphatase type 5
MTRYWYNCFASCLIVLCLAQSLKAQPNPVDPPQLPYSQAILQQLPVAYSNEAVALHLTATEQAQQEALKAAAISPTAMLTLVVRGLSSNPQGLQFLLQKVSQEASAETRRLILKEGIQPRIRHAMPSELPDNVRETLLRLAQQDSDSTVSLEAAQAMRRLQWGNYAQMLIARAEKARKGGDLAGADKLLTEGDQWIGWDTQINLPNFLRTPPPVFRLVPEDKPIRVVALGDFGTSSPAQIKVAATMREYQKEHPFDFGLTLGDNFYPNGAGSLNDPQWKSKWEDLYAPMEIKFYATLGNHDYGRPDSPAAEIMYSEKSPSWRMPATYYTYTAGPVQFFAIDTIELSDTSQPNAELAWLDAELAKSNATWKIVYGHYQIYSATRGDEQNLIQRLLPLLRNRADLYLCGHDHNLQELKEEAGVHFFVDGGGGAGLYKFRYPNYSHSDYKAVSNGFTVLEADNHQLVVRLISDDGKEIHQSTFHK